MTFWRGEYPLVLASGSAARQHLLRAAGLDFIGEPAKVDERDLESHYAGPPKGLAQHLARAKALAISANYPEHYVLGCDQILDFDDTIFHKPRDMAQAAAHLQQFSGKTHCLVSAFSLALRREIVAEDHDEACLAMRILSPAFITSYLAATGDDILQCAGAYKLEGLGIHLFDKIDGDHSTILGLPMLKLLPALRHLQLIA